MRRASHQGTWQLNAAEVNEFFNHPALIISIWNAAIANELQYRRLKETREVREFLISKGVDAERLSTPAWLAAGGNETNQVEQ